MCVCAFLCLCPYVLQSLGGPFSLLYRQQASRSAEGASNEYFQIDTFKQILTISQL